MSSFMREFDHLIIPLKIIRNATNNFNENNFIAEGGYGKVYRGKFLGSNGGTMGAVKRWTLSNLEGDPEFRREIMLLSDYKHENLISLLGFCYENNERILVYEYAPNTSLNYHVDDPSFTWVQRLKVCLGAARGLEYLHNPKGTERVLHCDVKSANILLDENWNAKIADFGLSKYGPANSNRSYLITQAKGTLGYCDPVFSETMIYTKESDVYSFGVVLFEVLCSRMSIDFGYNDNRRSLLLLVKDLSNELIRDTILDVNLRKQMSEYSFDTFITIAQYCLEPEQKQRPSMDLIVRNLETALHYQLTGETPDGAIEKWSSGKEGNLRALLSTLHDILGPKIDWKPVLETEMGSNRALKKHYGKAVLHFSPDKLQERRASITEQYICGKVLEILKNARARPINTERSDIHINTEEPDTPTMLEEPDKPTMSEEPDTPTMSEEPDKPTMSEESDTPTMSEEPDKPTMSKEPDTLTMSEESDSPFKRLLRFWESQ